MTKKEKAAAIAAIVLVLSHGTVAVGGFWGDIEKGIKDAVKYGTPEGWAYAGFEAAFKRKHGRAPTAAERKQFEALKAKHGAVGDPPPGADPSDLEINPMNIPGQMRAQVNQQAQAASTAATAESTNRGKTIAALAAVAYIVYRWGRR
jgi:hypothetical protein